MKLYTSKQLPVVWQLIVSLFMVFLITGVCYLSQNFLSHKIVALVLLMTVSLLAILFDIIPVLVAAVLSALIWNFFFIPPVFTFHISNAEDLLMFLLYFVVALINASLTFKIRHAEGKARDKEEKENTIKLYNTLLNSLSHELRTPISTILGAVDTLKESKLNESQQFQLLDEIDIASERLNRQVENLLNMSRLESGMLKLKLDWCDINDLVNSVIQKLSLSSSNHSIDFANNEKLPLFKLDAGIMDQVLYNLIHNAVQYTPDGSTIKIQAAYDLACFIMVVSDNGPGFPKQEIANAFDKFYRLPHSKTGGSGLGLSIVKGFVEAHGGTVILENSENGGAIFTIKIMTETSFITNLKNE